MKPAGPTNLLPVTTTRRGAKDRSGLGLRTIDELVSDGRLRSTKIGRRRLIFIDSIDALLEPRTEKTAA